MKITTVIEVSDKIMANWLLYGIRKGWEDCGCTKCTEMLEVYDEAKELYETQT